MIGDHFFVNFEAECVLCEEYWKVFKDDVPNSVAKTLPHVSSDVFPNIKAAML